MGNCMYIMAAAIPLCALPWRTWICFGTSLGSTVRRILRWKRSPNFVTMPAVKRSEENPILIPDPHAPWEAVAAHNPAVVESGGIVHLLYRAVSSKQKVGDTEIEIS